MKVLNGNEKPKVAVHKFSSCDGCQLAFLNAGPDLLALTELVDIKHFVEAGPIDHDAKVDIAFVEGSVSTSDELERIKEVRKNSRYLIAIGACATSGGLQALRNLTESSNEWVGAIYASPQHIDSLETVTSIAQHVRVDYELWGCPINTKQLFEVIRSLLYGIVPKVMDEALCLECKRSGNICTLVTQGKPCMGPVTRTGCGALCPRFGRDCFSCYGPSENPNSQGLAKRFQGIGLLPDEIERRFHFICNSAPAFVDVGKDARVKK